MPTVREVIAKKSYPAQGIEKGETYYSWALFRQPTQRSKTPPKPSQLCNPKLSPALRARETLEEMVPAATDPAAVVNLLDDAVEQVEGSVTDYYETVSNLEAAFPNGNPVLYDAEETRGKLEDYRDGLEAAANNINSMNVEDYTTVDQYESQPEDFDALNTRDRDNYMEAVRGFVDSATLEI